MLDVWPEVTRDGYLRPEYELDGVHLAREANLISLRAMVEHALNNTPPIRNVERYRLLHEMATGRTDHVYDVSTGMNSYNSLPAPPEPEAAPAAPPARNPSPRAVAAPATRGRLRSSLGRIKRLVLRFAPRPAPKAAAPPVARISRRFGPERAAGRPHGPGDEPPAPAPRAETVASEAESGDPFVRAARRFKAEWVCTLDLGRELAEKWRKASIFAWILSTGTPAWIGPATAWPPTTCTFARPSRRRIFWTTSAGTSPPSLSTGSSETVSDALSPSSTSAPSCPCPTRTKESGRSPGTRTAALPVFSEPSCT